MKKEVVRIISGFRKAGLLKKVKVVRFNKKHYLKHRENAREITAERIKYFSNTHGFECNRVSIRNQKTRWGSCSTKGNLNFNYKILFLEPEMRDYIIVHELCHLKEFNHSRKFWMLVEKILPDYLEIKKELKQQGLFFQ